METLSDKLKKIDKIPMHMPGHKRNAELFPYLDGFSDIDITEIDGFDNLHSPQGILKSSMENAAKMRGTNRAFYLVNGSTCGVLAAICAVVKSGDKVIMARNCHKSVYNGIELSGAKPFFVYPKITDGIFGSVEPEDIKNAIQKNPDAKLIILTCPTYEGVISDIKGICEIAHKYKIPVLADSAHGAHLGYGNFPKNASYYGADISVESLHKTLPSLTQTAICYLSGDLVCGDKLAEKLSVFETSSPSYILLSSIDGCINFLQNDSGELFRKWHDNLSVFYENAKNFENIRLLTNDSGEFFDFDKSKLVIFAEGSAKTVAMLLRKDGIEPEMVSNDYLILMTGLGDTKESLDKLYKTLLSVDKKVEAKKSAKISPVIPQTVMDINEARQKETEFSELDKSVGKICGEYIWAYPPGVPILVPGEKISGDLTDYFNYCIDNSTELYGGIKNGKISVLK